MPETLRPLCLCRRTLGRSFLYLVGISAEVCDGQVVSFYSIDIIGFSVYHAHTMLRFGKLRCFSVSDGFQRLILAVAILVCLASAMHLCACDSWAGDLRLFPPDEHNVEPNNVNTDSARGKGISNASAEGRVSSLLPANGPDTEISNRLLRMRDEEARRLQSDVEEEDQLMASAVRTMTREDASQWLAQFISMQPWNCPSRQQADWIEAILYAVERNRLPMCKEILGLVSCIISIESGFHVDPLAVDPSRGEDMSHLASRAESEFQQKYGMLLRVPPVPQLYAVYRERYMPLLLACKTEGEIEQVAGNVAEDLKKDLVRLPAVVRKVAEKELDKIAHVVRTKGSMQLNFPRARQMMAERGEVFTDRELTDYMYTLNGGVDVGVAALRPMFVQYAARYAGEANLSWLFLVGMDYHYGPFSSRNMMEQIRLRDLARKKVAIDGDFLHYDEKGAPEDRDSETLQTVAQIFPSMNRASILTAFVLGKDQHYIYTDLHRAIYRAHWERFGETPFAVIGELWTGPNATVKHGTSWKTSAYLRKLDRYLNSIPWDL